GHRRPPNKALEDAVAQFGWYAGAMVLHVRDRHPAQPAHGGDLDGSACVAMAVGIGNEIVEDLSEAIPVGHHLEWSSAPCGPDLAVGVGVATAFNRGGDSFGEVNLAQPEIQRMTLDASHVEEVGHQPRQAPLLTFQGVESATHSWVEVIEGHERGGSGEKACQGRSELVGHAREQLPSPPVALS